MVSSFPIPEEQPPAYAAQYVEAVDSFLVEKDPLLYMVVLWRLTESIQVKGGESVEAVLFKQAENGQETLLSGQKIAAETEVELAQKLNNLDVDGKREISR
ncbi:hypothetical protein L204_104942 [Cryptococcus depauperatus]